MPDSLEAQVFKYVKPETKGKSYTRLCRTNHIFGVIQVLNKGGENNLHSHKHLDGFWMVLSGRVRFYGEGDKVVAELGKYEGIMVPRGYKYWFESVGEEEAELLQVEASDVPLHQKDMADERVDHAPKKESYATFQTFEAATTSV